MATISVGEGNYVRPYRRVRQKGFPEAPSQAFIVGDILIFSATADKGNKVAKGGADPNNIVGVAAEKATGVEGTTIVVWLADEDGEFRAHVGDTQTLDADDVGDSYGLVEDTTNKIWRVDRTDTTNTRVVITELLHAAGDVNGAVVCRFKGANRLPYGA